MRIILFAVFLFSSAAHADKIGFNPCQGIRNKECTPYMESVIRAFNSGQSLNAENSIGTYNGDCHYYSVDYGSDHKHYSALYIEAKPSQPGVYFNGAFSFFAGADEYADWGYERAKDTYPNPFRFLMTTHQNDYSIANYSPEEGIWQFWMTQNPATKEISMVSFWGHRSRGFCKFQFIE